MNKNILLLSITILSLLTFVSCKEDDLVNGGSKATTGTTTTGGNTSSATKCYISQMVEQEDGETYTTKLSYNTKNILEKIDMDGAVTSYTYDANGRVTKQISVDGAATETYTYAYDSKGNITNIKYNALNTNFTLFINEYKITTNASGLITKVVAVTEDGNVDFPIEYDAKNNIKKIMVTLDGTTETLIENYTFDSKTSTHANAGLNKVVIPQVIVGAFFGENLTYYMNANNVLTDRTFGAFSQEPALSTYKYEYSQDGMPSKMSFSRKEGTETSTGTATYGYNCK
jgi:YD repeat-containing protein